MLLGPIGIGNLECFIFKIFSSLDSCGFQRIYDYDTFDKLQVRRDIEFIDQNCSQRNTTQIIAQRDTCIIRVIILDNFYRARLATSIEM